MIGGMAIPGVRPAAALLLLAAAVAGCAPGPPAEAGEPDPAASGPGGVRADGLGDEPPDEPYGGGPAEGPRIGPRPCFDGLRVEPRITDAAMGLRAFTVALVNCGTEPYRLEGYPAVAVLDEAGAALAMVVNEGLTVTVLEDEPAVAPVTVAPGEEARTAVFWRSIHTGFDAPLTGRYLTVTPAPGLTPQTVPAHLDLGDTPVADVLPWHLPADPEPVGGRPDPSGTGPSGAPDAP